MAKQDQLVLWFEDLDNRDAEVVGGKAASLGEMFGALHKKGVRVPNGFATTALAYSQFIDATHPAGTWAGVAHPEGFSTLAARVREAERLADLIVLVLEDAQTDDHLEMHARTQYLRDLVVATPMPKSVADAVRKGYEQLCDEYGRDVDVAVRSSATCEDSEMASFAGQCESYLNVHGIDSVLSNWRCCVSSLFTERAVSYQLDKGLDPRAAALSVVIMKMVRSDLATSGVIFTIDPDSGHREIIHISSAYGLGELVVQGSVSPDSFLVWKEGLRKDKPAIVSRRLGAKDQKMIYSMQGGTSTESVDVITSRQRAWSLTDEEVLELARMALVIEEHYGRPMDIEWAKDGRTWELYIVQARPETAHAPKPRNLIERYNMDPGLTKRLNAEGKMIAQGQSVGTRIGAGKVRLYRDYEEVILKKRALRNLLAEGKSLDEISPEMHVFDPGDVLVTELTTPDWEPMMKQASLIVTEKGGRTSHAAIIAREFGIPAIVGCENATKILKPLTEVTGSCAHGEDGFVFEGNHPFEIERTEIDENISLETKIKLNVGFPGKALDDAQLPCDGVGLARLEFILTSEVGVHPLALLYRAELGDYLRTGKMAAVLEPYADVLERESEEELQGLLGAIDRRTPSYADKREFFVDRVRDGVALICAAFYPRPVLVRLSDLKSNEYRQLLGGRIFEPVEENPMIAWRGAGRYLDPTFMPAFEMECDALREVYCRLGLDNLQIMVPFCRTPEEGAAVRKLLDERGLARETGVPLHLMIELPSNVIQADDFIDSMDLEGGSIGSNDLVQTIYAVSRDDLENYAHPVDARSSAAKTMIREAVKRFREKNIEIGICGQAPSDFPDETPAFLVECGINSISVTPDTVLQVRVAVAKAEAAVKKAKKKHKKESSKVKR